MEDRRIAAYCRVSTDKEDQLLSLKAQKEFFLDYAKRNNLELVRLYADEGISGTKLKNRRELQRLLADAEKGLFSCVYVKDVSRLARNVVDFLQSIRQLKLWNVDCRFITANMSTNDGELTLTILAAVAQEESANLSRRVKFGKKRNARKGRVPNLVYGYDKQAGDYFSLRINPLEAEVVRRIYALYGYRGEGMKRIADLLNREGLRTKRQCKWSQQAVSTILHNELYNGRVINGKEEIIDFLSGKRVKQKREDQIAVERPELRIVDAELFRRVQSILQERKQKFCRQRYSHKYIFSTLLKCGECGYIFRRIRRSCRREYVRWVCSGRNSRGRDFCANQSVLSEEELFSAIAEYFLAPVNWDKLWLYLERELKQRYFQENGDNLILQLKSLTRKKEKQIALFEADLLSLEELQRRLKAYELKLQAVEKKLLVREKEGQWNELERYYAANLPLVFRELLRDNYFLKQLIREITVHEGGRLEVYLHRF